MKDLNSGRPHAFYTAQTAEQAKLLTDSTSKAFFKPFVGRDRTVSQAAAELGCNLNTLLYRIKTFVRADLLYVVREEKRAGRPVKVYRSVGDEIFIPFNSTPHADLEELLKAQLEPFLSNLLSHLAHAYRQNGSKGQRLYRDNKGTVWTNMTESATGFSREDVQTSVMLYNDITTRLTDDEVRTLQRALSDLFTQSLPTPDKQGKTYTLQVALVPTPD